MTRTERFALWAAGVFAALALVGSISHTHGLVTIAAAGLAVTGIFTIVASTRQIRRLTKRLDEEDQP